MLQHTLSVNLSVRCVRCVAALFSVKGRLVSDNYKKAVVPQEPLSATVKRRKLAWFIHVTRHDSLSKPILQGTLEGWRRRGRQRKCWMDNIKKKEKKSGHPCPCQNCSQGPPAEKTGRGSLLNRPSCPPDDPNGQGTELD